MIMPSKSLPSPLIMILRALNLNINYMVAILSLALINNHIPERSSTVMYSGIRLMAIWLETHGNLGFI